MPGNRGNRADRGGGRAPLPRNVQVSKKIAWLLRHGAEKEGLTLGEGGFINAQDVLNNRNLRSLKVTFEEMRQLVADNDKQRFTLVPASEVATDTANGEMNSHTPAPSDNPKDWLIRANQGHSLKVESEGLLQPITENEIPETAVHGTTHASWPLIVQSGGLKVMGRNHIHLASGLPAGFQSVVELDKDTVAAPVISGMRKSSTVLIYLDLRRAMETGLQFWRSDNGVILTEGNEDGLLSMEFFKRVEDRTGAGVLMEDGKVVKEAPEKWSSKGKAKG